VVGSCEHDNEPLDSSTTELVSYKKCTGEEGVLVEKYPEVSF
jgi:hypothetical protein